MTRYSLLAARNSLIPMKALVSDRFGDLSRVGIRETDSPEVGDHDVLIQVAACGLNFPDLLILEGKYQFTPELPFTPGGEITGVVLRAGSEATQFYPGQRVFAIERWGGLAERMALPKNRVFPLPDRMGLKEGASFLYNFSTALYALKNRGKAKEGQVLLILGAAGGVGLAAVQLGKIFGLEIIAAAGNVEKLTLCASFGADHLVNYNEENIRERVNEITAKRGADLVLDVVGGRFSEPAVRSLAWGGKYLVTGFASGEIPALPLNLLLLKGAEVRGVFWGKFSREEPLKQQENIEEIFRYYSDNRIRAYIVQEYPLEDAARALKDYQERKIKGKTIVICNPRLIERDKRVSPETRPLKFRFLSKLHILESVGALLGESHWLQVTQEVINDFADATGDHQWIHISAEKAARAPVGSTIAHGFLTLSLAPRFLSEIYEMPFVQMGINYGVDKLRFLAPVKVNSEIRMTARLLTAESVRNEGIKMRIEATYFVRGMEKPVCSAELLSVVY